MNPYPKYKDSGVDWFRELPSHWSHAPAKSCFARKKALNTGMRVTNRLALTMNGVVPRSMEDNEGLQTNDFEGYQIFEPGDLAFKLIDLQNISTSRVGLVPEQGIMSPAYIRLKPFVGVIDVKYSYWFFMNLYWQRVFNQLGGGVRQTLQAEELLNLRLVLPPLPEQRAIAAYLDRETAKIDTLIAKQEQLIALLEEKRQALISQAVTKGLNPKVKMKDSGVEWLGEVPGHWEIRRAGYLFEEQERPVIEGQGIVTAFRDGQVCLRTNRRTEGFTMADLEVGYQGVRSGDLVVHGMDAFAGAIGVSEDDGRCTPEYSVLAAQDDSVNLPYFAQVLRVMALRNYIYVICPSVRERAPRFRFSKLKDTFLPVPPKHEQLDIINHINESRNQYGLIKATNYKAVQLLQEKRSALISAAVTGKIDVRDQVLT